MSSWPPDYHLLVDAADPYGRRRRRKVANQTNPRYSVGNPNERNPR